MESCWSSEYSPSLIPKKCLSGSDYFKLDEKITSCPMQCFIKGVHTRSSPFFNIFSQKFSLQKILCLSIISNELKLDFYMEPLRGMKLLIHFSPFQVDIFHFPFAKHCPHWSVKFFFLKKTKNFIMVSTKAINHEYVLFSWHKYDSK